MFIRSQIDCDSENERIRPTSAVRLQFGEFSPLGNEDKFIKPILRVFFFLLCAWIFAGSKI